MRARINRKLYEIYGMDIESHNDLESIAKRETSMWLGCFIKEESNMDDEASYFYTMDECLERGETLRDKIIPEDQYTGDDDSYVVTSTQEEIKLNINRKSLLRVSKLIDNQISAIYKMF